VPPTAADIQAWFDAMVLVQAQKALGLTDAQYPQFVGRLKALQDARRRNQRQRNQIVQEIQRMLNGRSGPVDEAQLRDKLKTLDDLQESGAAEVRKAYENLGQVLDVRQQARFRVFEEQIERRRFEILLNARRGRGAGAGRGRY
jgi:Spy/CpxP family protein refolding chaperone